MKDICLRYAMTASTTSSTSPSNADATRLQDETHASLPAAPFDHGTPPDAEQLTVQLDELRAKSLPLKERAPELDRLYVLGMASIEQQLPILIDSPFPIHRKNRQLVRSLQRLLGALADDLLDALNAPEAKQTLHPALAPELTLWRAVRILSRHLLISDLVAAPSGVGIWQLLHRTYATALGRGLSTATPKGTSISLQHLYYATVLLGCAQPASFSSREIGFVAEYLEQFADQTDPGNDTMANSPAAFWVDTLRDMPAIACSRKTPPEDAVIHYFCCDRIAELLQNQLESLEEGLLPTQLGLPEFAGTPGGHGVMRRLIGYWGDPGKRRFPRRRQNYRATLCVGLPLLWQMFYTNNVLPDTTSTWMIINESPDGYAVMHVKGKTGAITVGDVTAVKTETGDSWQICIVRWALSENQEHLELGLQIIATQAIPAFLAASAYTDGSDSEHLPVLVLPEIPHLRQDEMLVVPSGTLRQQTCNLILVVEKENLEIREVRRTGLTEQNGQIEVFTIEPELPLS